MPAFATSQAVSPQVAATLSRFAHNDLLDRLYQRARTYNISPFGDALSRAMPKGLPEQLTLIFDGRDRGKPTQLHLGRLPVHPRFWSYDPDRGLLFYKFKSDGVDHAGCLTFGRAGSVAFGTLSVGDQYAGVRAVLQPVSYSGNVALNTGAYVTGVAPDLSLQWDATAPSWSSATWIENALTFTWQVTQQFEFGEPTYGIAVSFADQQTNTPWAPDTGEFSSVLDANYNFTTTLQDGFDPPSDDRTSLPSPGSSITSVFPYVLAFDVSDGAETITGALLTVEASQEGTVLGLRGTVVNPSIAGIYTVCRENSVAGAMAVYASRLYINDTLVKSASIAGNHLAWSGLTAAQQQYSGLPESGALTFKPDGAQFRATQGGITGRRLRPEQVARQFCRRPIATHPAITAARAVSSTLGLDPSSLYSMSQFQSIQDPNNPDQKVWYDVVQQLTMNDFNKILLYYMDDTMRQTYYGGPKPVLPAWLQGIAAQAPSGTDPQAAYQSLATAYLTNILSSFPEAGANQLNAVRAAVWLKSQMAANPVFQQQTTAIYATEFVKLPNSTNAALPQYQQDQQDNGSSYAQKIASDANQWQQNLQNPENPSYIQDPTALAAMLQLVTDLSQQAIDTQCFWAYWYFRYLTSPAQLQVIQMMSMDKNVDGSAFMRQCQTDVALLTLLDSSNSNKFAREYLNVIQLFQIGNMLPQLFDLGNTDPDDFVFDIQLVLNGIVKNYEGNSDKDIQDAVQAAEALANDEQLRDYIELIQGIAASSAGIATWDNLALRMEFQITPLIASKLGQTIAAGAARVLMMAIAGLGVYGIIEGSLQWKSLSAPQQAMLVTGAAALGIELVCAIVKRGVAINGVWEVDLIRAILKGLGSGDIFNSAFRRLNNSFAKWIVDRNVDTQSPSFFRNLVVDWNTGDFEETDDQLTLAQKFFGRNLDEFLAYRIGAFVAVVFLALSIWAAVDATDPLERLADGWMAAAAGLDFIAAVSGWALTAAEFAAETVATICSVIGVFGILAALVGLALLLYEIFKPQKNPVQQFASDYAQPAGFFMPYGSEIDYFLGYVQNTEPQRVGCSFVVDAGATVLTIASDGTTVQAKSQSYGPNSVFAISTDGNGRSRVVTLVQDPVGPEGVIEQHGIYGRVLTWELDNTVSFQPPFDPNNTEYYRQLWSIGLQASPQKDGSFPSSGTFRVTTWGPNGPTSDALVWNGTNLVLGSGPNWTIAQEPLAPTGLSMQNILLFPFSKGQSFSPALQYGSAPLQWSVTPDLPSFLSFDKASGKITTQKAEDLPLTKLAQYTVSVKNDVGTAPAPTATFTIVVDMSGKPPKPPPPKTVDRAQWYSSL